MTTETTTATTITAETVIDLLAGDLRAENAIYLLDDGEVLVSNKHAIDHFARGRDYTEVIDNRAAYDWMRGDGDEWEKLDAETQHTYAGWLAESLREDLVDAANRLDERRS